MLLGEVSYEIGRQRVDCFEIEAGKSSGGVQQAVANDVSMKLITNGGVVGQLVGRAGGKSASSPTGGIKDSLYPAFLFLTWMNAD